jgi:hypothetical protein
MLYHKIYCINSSGGNLMSNRENLQETDNKEKYYEHLTYPNLGNEGMSPLINGYNALMPQFQNIYLYGTPGHFGPENHYNSPTHSDNPFIHERLDGYYNKPHYYELYSGQYYAPYGWPYQYNLYYNPYYIHPMLPLPPFMNMIFREN